MPRITTEERAAALGRALRRLRDLPEVLLVADDATVWGIDRSSVEPGWLLTDRLVPPPGATALEPEVVERARAALRRVSRVRDVESLLVFPALRGWSAADVRGVSGDGLERVAWAFAPERSACRPRGVLMSAPGGALRFRTRVTLPAVGGRALAFDLAVADRLFDLCGPRLADRWLRSCAARAWPDVELSGELARLHEVVDAASDVRAVSEVVREWAYARFGAGELASAARAAPDLGALRAVLARIVDELWPGERAADAVLTLLLADPGARYAVPGREQWQIYDLAYTLRSASPRWRARTRAHVPRWLAEPLLDVPFPIQKLPADLAIRVMRVREGFPAPQAGWPGRKLRRYLALLDRADEPMREFLMQQWVVDLCASRLGNSAFGLLAGAQRLTPSTADAVASLLAGLRPGAVASSLQRLDRPVPSATAGPLAAATGLDAELIRRWEHYRTLIGEDVALPRRALALVTLPSSLAAEAVAIRARFDDSHPRLATLEDPAAVASRLAAARRVVTRSLERAIAELRMRALRVLLEETARAQIGPLAARLPLTLLADLALLSGLDETERKLLGRFMESVSRGASLDAWPENVAWLSSRRFDALAWREGFDVVVDGVRYVCERDPVRALHMGTWFDTCLSLDGGFNQFAALNNTIEANRHVVYGYSAAGDVLARRLLAVTDEGVLLKYHTYAFADGAAHAAALDRLCLELAERCGLRPGVEGSPRSLTASEFYDDGTEQWAPGAPVPAAGAGTPARP